MRAEVRLNDGEVVLVRLLVPADRAAVEDLHRRCTPKTLVSRYFTEPVRLQKWMFDWMCDRSHGRSVAVLSDDRIVALAHLMRTDEPGVADIAVLIEDAWQGRGLGRALTRLAVAKAAELGFTALHADIQAANERMRTIVKGLGGVRHPSRDANVTENYITVA